MNSAISVLAKECRFGFLVASAFLLGGESELCVTSLRIKMSDSDSNVNTDIDKSESKLKVFLSGQFTAKVEDFLKERNLSPANLSFKASINTTNNHEGKDTNAAVVNRQNKFMDESDQRWDAKNFGTRIPFVLRKIYRKLKTTFPDTYIFDVDLTMDWWKTGLMRSMGESKIKPFMCHVLKMLDLKNEAGVKESITACKVEVEMDGEGQPIKNKYNDEKLTLAVLENLKRTYADKDSEQDLSALIRLKQWEVAYIDWAVDKFEHQNNAPHTAPYEVFTQESNALVEEFLVNIEKNDLPEGAKPPSLKRSQWFDNLHHDYYLLHFGFSKNINSRVQEGAVSGPKNDKKDLFGARKWIAKMMSDVFFPEGCHVDEVNLIFAMMSGIPGWDLVLLQKKTQDPKGVEEVLEEFYNMLSMGRAELKKLWIPDMLIQDNEADDQHAMVLAAIMRHAVGIKTPLEIVLQLPLEENLRIAFEENYEESLSVEDGSVTPNPKDFNLSAHYTIMMNYYENKIVEKGTATCTVLQDAQSINQKALSVGAMALIPNGFSTACLWFQFQRLKLEIESCRSGKHTVDDAPHSSTTNENNNGVRPRRARHGARVDHGNLFDVGNLVFMF